MSNVPLQNCEVRMMGFLLGMVRWPTISTYQRQKKVPTGPVSMSLCLGVVPVKNKQSNRHANRMTERRRLKGISTSGSEHAHTLFLSKLRASLYSFHDYFKASVMPASSTLCRYCNFKSVCVAASPPCRGLVLNEERCLTAAHQLQ